MTAILGWGDRHFRTGRNVCIIDPDNTPSLRLAARSGFSETHRTTFTGDPTIVLERPFPLAAGPG